MTRDWAGILPDILSIIFSKLNSFTILWPVQAVCRSWRQVSLEPHIWRRIDLRDNPEPLNISDIKTLTKEAVKRSKGRVEELYCGNLGARQVLVCIANQSSGLKLLSLSWQFGLSCYLMAEFFNMCPLLEDLHISYYRCSPEISDLNYSAEIFGDIVRRCPKLKCIRLVSQFWYEIYSNPKFKPECDIDIDTMNILPNTPHDYDAPNITTTMTQLRDLQLINNMISNKRLHILLDKCPHLDLLDIRLCQHILLDSEMKARLERIKIVKLPHDPIKKYETEMRCSLYFNYDGSVLDNTEYDDSDIDYMYDDYYSPHEECGDEYDFCIS